MRRLAWGLSSSSTVVVVMALSDSSCVRSKAFADARDCNGGVGVEGGALALLVPSGEDRDGPARAQLGVAFSTPCMGVGFLHSATPSEPRVQILRQPARSDGLALHVSFLAL